MDQNNENKLQKRLRPVGDNILVEMKPSTNDKVRLGIVLSHVNPPGNDFNIGDVIGFKSENALVVAPKPENILIGNKVLIERKDVLFVLDDINSENDITDSLKRDVNYMIQKFTGLEVSD